MAEYKIYPRLLALAERAWHQAKWVVPYQQQGKNYSPNSGHFSVKQRAQQNRQWQQFAKTIALKEMPKLALADVNYRIATIGAKMHNGMLHANSIFPQTAIEYRVNGGDWLEYEQPVAVFGDVDVRGKTAKGVRKGRFLSFKSIN